ncbi:type II secretion system protein [Bdellovibrio sp. KM01]|uniref:type II secretion system protein n=1 Tax=Bdellovibrio sp. KM01 TaxID=2748865 RepID=UPI0015E9C51C|nr:type II secretion system protein [Bdellovibrio sp. KM01]QLY24641.1 type II secretion system protein [Bdellovibrio sp. KM01]
MGNISGKSGYTLIEVLVSLALVAILVGALGAIFQTSFKGANLVEMRNSAANLNLSWQQSLTNPEICEKNFKNMSFSETGNTSAEKFVDMGNKPLLAPGIKSPVNDLLVQTVQAKVREEDWKHFKDAQSGLGTNNYIANIDIQIELERQKEQISSRSNSLAVSVPVYLNAAGVVVGCLSSQADMVANAQQVACEQLGGVFDIATSQCNFKQDCASIPANSAVSKECFDKLTAGLSDQLKDLNSTPTAAVVKGLQGTIKDCLANSQGAVVATDKTTCQLGSTNFSATPTEFSYTQGATNYTLSDPVLAKYLFELVIKYQTDGLMKITVGAK